MTVTLSYIIGTFLGLGYAPIASGTVASAAAAILWWYVAPVPAGHQWLVSAIIVVVGIWTSHVVAKQVKDEDPHIVVIDEVAGMWLALAGVPHTLPVVLVAFGLFRLFDIGKWTPMKQLERLHGGFGIMMDDVAAGLISRALLALILKVTVTWRGV